MAKERSYRHLKLNNDLLVLLNYFKLEEVLNSEKRNI